MRNLFLIIALCISVNVTASELTRQATIAKIVEAQGLQQSFEQQLVQSNEQAREMGNEIYKKILVEGGIVDGQENPKLKQVFTRYIDRCLSMFTAKDFVETWTRFYGTNLSEQELHQILAYYKSPVGKKDVLASQAALSNFTRVMGEESQKRMNGSIEQLIVDLKEAIGATNSDDNADTVH